METLYAVIAVLVSPDMDSPYGATEETFLFVVAGGLSEEDALGMVERLKNERDELAQEWAQVCGERGWDKIYYEEMIPDEWLPAAHAYADKAFDCEGHPADDWQMPPNEGETEFRVVPCGDGKFWGMKTLI